MTTKETIVRIELGKKVINPMFTDTKEIAIITKKRENKLFQETVDLTDELDYWYYRTCKRELAIANGESLLK